MRLHPKHTAKIMLNNHHFHIFEMGKRKEKRYLFAVRKVVETSDGCASVGKMSGLLACMDWNKPEISTSSLARNQPMGLAGIFQNL